MLCPLEGVVDIHALLTLYLSTARRAGFALHTNCRVEELLVEAGRVVGASVVSRLHSDPVFKAQMDLARKEIEAARAAGAAAPGPGRPDNSISPTRPGPAGPGCRTSNPPP